MFTAHTIKEDKVHAYQNTTHSLGTLIFKASCAEEMMDITSKMDRYYKVVVE